MTLLVLGLLLFFGTHALTMARAQRDMVISRFGASGYKAGYSLLSIVGFVLIIWGFVVYRRAGYIPVWSPPAFMNHLTMALMLPAVVLLFAYLLPPGRISATVRHPMLVMIKTWALAHLLSNGDLGSILLFGSFLIYAVVDRISLKRRGVAPVVGRSWGQNDWAALGMGVVTYFVILYWLHPILFGVAVLPRLA